MSDTAAVPAADNTQPKAYLSVASWLRFLIPAAAGLALDLSVKAYAFPQAWEHTREGMLYAGRHPAIDPDTFQSADPTQLIPHVLGFTTTVNGGAVFGSFQGYTGLFLAFGLVALAVIVWVFIGSGAKQRTVHLALGLITAGALGNLYDRAMFHGVRDMLRFLCFVFNGNDYYPYIFNVADVLLCVGVPLLILRWMLVKDELAK